MYWVFKPFPFSVPNPFKILLFQNLLSLASRLDVLYESYADPDDGFLYMIYSEEDTAGGSIWGNKLKKVTFLYILEIHRYYIILEYNLNSSVFYLLSLFFWGWSFFLQHNSMYI